MDLTEKITEQAIDYRKTLNEILVLEDLEKVKELAQESLKRWITPEEL